MEVHQTDMIIPKVKPDQSSFNPELVPNKK